MHTLVILLTVLESLFTALTEKTFTTDFSVTMGAEQSQPMTYNGTLTMQGECFRVNMMDIEAAYDGRTMYMFQEATNELMLSNPTPQELAEANPFIFAREMREACNVTEREAKDGTTIITLTPKVKSDISRITLTIKDNLPRSIEIHEGTKTTTLRAKNPQWTTNKQVWTIDKPDAFINDLR